MWAPIKRYNWGVCRAGHDDINIHGVKEHESYRGDRTQASLSAFAENLVPSAGQPHHYIRCVFPALFPCWVVVV